MTASGPARFSQKAVDRYAAAIATVLKRWPEPVVFNPAPLSVETFSNRLRDAITAVLEHARTHPVISTIHLASINADLVVRTRDNRVVVGSREATKQQSNDPIFTSSVPGATYVGEVDVERHVVVQCLATLLSERVIHGPFKLTNIHDFKLLAETLSSYDIGLERLDDHTASIV